MLPSLREQLKLFFSNPILLSCIFSWLGAQFLKTAINLIYGRIHSLYDLLEMMISNQVMLISNLLMVLKKK